MVASGTLYFNRSLRFGSGVLNQIGQVLPAGISRLALIGAPSFLNSERGKDFQAFLEGEGLKVSTFLVHGEPSPDTVDPITEALKANNIQAVIGLGGGSVLDAAKAAAAMVFEVGSVQDYLEGVGTKTPSGRTLSLTAVPTTSGTGSEATKNAVISRPGRAVDISAEQKLGFKKSLRHDNFLPSTALLDPELTVSCPAGVTASCGIDAFSQLLESYLSTKANPVTDALAWDGLTRFLRAFPSLMNDLENPSLRMEVALGSYYSGLTLANAGLGAVHGMAGALGGLLPVAHGTACGTLLYETFRATVEVWKTKGAEGDQQTAWEKMDRLGSFLAQKHFAAGEGSEVLLEELEQWQNRYAIPRLGELGLKREDLPAVAAGGNKNHPYQFSQEERLAILEKRL